MKKKNKGFTLLEMMIVIAIIGVLAAFALPSYNRYVLRTNRAAAAAVMMEIAGVLEKQHLQHSTYTADFINSINNSKNYNVSPAGDPAEARYNISIPIATFTEQTYVITAVPTGVGGQDEDECGTLTLNSFGVKSAIISPGHTRNDCW